MGPLPASLDMPPRPPDPILPPSPDMPPLAGAPPLLPSGAPALPPVGAPPPPAFAEPPTPLVPPASLPAAPLPEPAVALPPAPAMGDVPACPPVNVKPAEPPVAGWPPVAPVASVPPVSAGGAGESPQPARLAETNPSARSIILRGDAPILLSVDELRARAKVAAAKEPAARVRVITPRSGTRCTFPSRRACSSGPREGSGKHRPTSPLLGSRSLDTIRVPRHFS
jgi:hypothetical protein